MKYLKCPILGDPVYSRKDKRFPDATLMLHAYKLSIAISGENEKKTFKALLPERFQNILKDINL